MPPHPRPLPKGEGVRGAAVRSRWQHPSFPAYLHLSRVSGLYLFGASMKLLRALLISAVALSAPVVAAEKPAAPASKPATKPAAVEAYPVPPTIADVKY